MKKFLVVLVVLAFAAMAGSAFAASIKNSKHDLSTGSAYSVGAGIDEICVFCHTPHNADVSSAGPLWNRSYTDAVTLYTSPSGTKFGATLASIGAVSKACLSCHDGTTAVDALKNYHSAARGGSVFITNSFTKIGDGAGDLSNDHPIGFDPTVYNNGDYKAAQSVLPLFPAGVGGKIECATCHMVHDPANGFFLRMSNANSDLCLTCHNK